MNPLQEYIAIIHTRQQDPLPKGQYGERHHIVPRACGGCDQKWNLVKLTPEEHFMAHYWLTFIYPIGYEHESMVYGWNCLSKRVKGECISAEEYGRLRRESAKIHSIRMKGRPSNNKGKKFGPHTDEWRRKVSQKLKGRPVSAEKRERISKALMGHPSHTQGMKFGPRSAEARRKMSEAAKKRRASPETRRKMSEAQKARQERLRQERKATA